MNLQLFNIVIFILITLSKTYGVSHKTDRSVERSSTNGSAIFGPARNLAAGVNIHFVSGHTKDLDMIAAAGLKYIRTDFVWQEIEYSKGRYNWDAYDELTNNLGRRSLKAIFILDYSNSLYEDSVSSKDPLTGSPIRDIAAPVKDVSVEAYSRWATSAAMRYKGRKIVWEIWNEPNISFWKPDANVHDYSRLALEACRAIRKADPQAVIIGPGTSGIPYEFIEEFLKSGVLEYIDGISVHPYRSYSLAPESAASDFIKLQDLIRHYTPPGNDQVPVLNSEWGYSSCTRGLSPGLQAEYAVRMQLSALLNGIPVSIWYDWKNDGIDSADFEQNCGIVTNSFEPKPAYMAFKTLCTQLNGFTLTHRLEMESENDYILLFSEGKGIFRICAWTTAKSHSVKLDLTAAGPAIIEGVDGFGNPFDLNSGKDFMNISLTSMPQYITIPCGTRLY